MAIKIFPFFPRKGPQAMAMYTFTQVKSFVENTDPTDALSLQLSDEIVTPIPQAPPEEGEPEPDPIYMPTANAQLVISDEMARALFANPDQTKVYFAKSPALEIRWATLSMTYMKTKVFSIYGIIYRDWLYNQVSSGQMTLEEFQQAMSA